MERRLAGDKRLLVRQDAVAQTAGRRRFPLRAEPSGASSAAGPPRLLGGASRRRAASWSRAWSPSPPAAVFRLRKIALGKATIVWEFGWSDLQSPDSHRTAPPLVLDKGGGRPGGTLCHYQVAGRLDQATAFKGTEACIPGAQKKASQPSPVGFPTRSRPGTDASCSSLAWRLFRAVSPSVRKR